MKKRGFKSWVSNRIETQRKMTMAAAAGMAAVGLVLFLLEGGFLYLVFSLAYSRATAFLVIAGLFGLMGLYSWYQARKDLGDTRHKAISNNKKMLLNVAPPTSQVWSWAFGSMDPDRTILEKIVGIAALVPRLFCASWHTWQRLDEVKNIDPDTTLEVMKMLFRSDHSVTPQAIARGIGDADLKKAIKDVSLLDGIVILTKDEISLSIAPRLNDSLDAWRAAGQEEKDTDDLFAQ